MVGDSGNSNSADSKPPESKKPFGKTFSCTQCGASITVRYPGAAMSAVCDSCHAVIDVTDENYHILTDFFSRTKNYTGQIPLGTRGELFGKKWEVLGYLMRDDVASKYTWEEYLLFNPYYGYRWLTNNSSHWNFVTMVKEKPILGYKKARFRGEDYLLYYNGQAEISYVIGEFYWLVLAGNKVEMRDFIFPPYMLSSERDSSGVVWSLSEYVKPEVIQKAFDLKAIARPVSIAPNEPSTATADWKQIKLVWMVVLVILTAIQFMQFFTSTNFKAFESSYTYTPNTKSTTSITTPVFTLNKDSANVDINVAAPVDNSWFYVGVDLVNNETGETFPFERSVEYYHGYEDGENWSEGGQTSHILISRVPKGDYYMNMDYESGSYPPNSLDQRFTVTVMRDVPMFANYFWCLFFASIIPGLSWISYRQTEIARWRDSDYSPFPQISVSSS